MTRLTTYDKTLSLLLLIMVALTMPGCTADDYDENRRTVTVELHPYVTQYCDPMSATTRGTWEPPTGYQPYSALLGIFPEQQDLTNAPIGVYFTRDGKEAKLGAFSYYGAKWHLTLELNEADTYYIYGYIPARNITPAITPNDSYSNGATLTLNNLSTISNTDVCVIVGAKDGTSDDTVEGLAEGQFAYEAKVGEGPEYANHVFLLFDHIYAGLRFSFKVNSSYAELRTIKLKKLELGYKGETVDDVVNFATHKKYSTATVTLAKNGEGATPIQSVSIVQDDTSEDTEAVTLFEANGETAPITLDKTTATAFFGGFLPSSGSREFVLKSTYDVYDRNGNLIRKNCKATNTFNLATIFGSTLFARGTLLTLNLTVNPTYIYILSDPDLDNPTVTMD